MDRLLLEYDVVTLEGEVLLPARSRLDPATLADLLRRRGSSPCRSHPFAAHAVPWRDLQEFLACPPYRTIFDDPAETAVILELMGQARLVAPLIDALDYFREKDYHTYRHCLMVFALSTLLARQLFPGDPRSRLGAQAGPSHDLGKICVPPAILRKNTPLTRRETGSLRHHAVAGYVLLAYYTGDLEHLTARVARDHHERLDGSGYPRGIGEIDAMAEIVILSDVYDALISPRPYRPVSFDNRSALEELTRMAQAGQIGWTALKALIASNRKGRQDFHRCRISLEQRGRPPRDNIYGQVAEESEERSRR